MAVIQLFEVNSGPHWSQVETPCPVSPTTLPVGLLVSLAGNQHYLLCVTSEAVQIRARRFSLATPQFKAATRSEYLDLNCSLDHFTLSGICKEKVVLPCNIQNVMQYDYWC